MVETDLGLGMAVERLADDDGKLAPTLRRLLKTGQFGPEHVAPLETFFEHLHRSPVVIGDLNAGNLVWTRRDGDHRFILVDGLGDSTVVPVLAGSRVLNARQKLQAAERLRRRYRKSLP